MLRKHLYGGIPPTDPRILAMTDEQIELEFAHLELDQMLRNSAKEIFTDPTYEEYEKQVEAEESGANSVPELDSSDTDDSDDWEDV
jgi:hypothetical protein